MKLFNLSQKNYNIYDSLLLIIALTISVGGLVYYFYALNWLGLIISLAIIIIAFWKTRRYFINSQKSSDQTSSSGWFLIVIYIIIYAALVFTLLSSQSDRSLISPWQVVPSYFFWLYTLLSLVLVWLLSKSELGKIIKLIIISLHYFISFSVAAVIYKIGYGFDPFIHQATMQLIDAKGLVLPKTPYYSGQYGLIIIWHKLSGLTIASLNKFLVPGLASLLLPTAIYRFLEDGRSVTGNQKNEKNTINILLTALFLLTLTFSPFIVTTPQNLSYLFLILTLLLSLKHNHWLKITILAVATAIIHPLTGLPALVWASLIIINQNSEKIKATTKKYLRLSVWSFSALALPLALFLTSGHSYKTGSEVSSSLFNALNSLLGNPASAGREDWLSNLIYFFANNYQLAWLVIIISLLFYFWRTKDGLDQIKKQQLSNTVLVTSSLAIAYLLSGLINFSDLINYEQADYAKRIPIIILIFLSPLIISALEKLINKIRQQEAASRIIWLGLGVISLSISLYLSYPRFDKYWNSRGYSTGANDIKAVQLVAEKSSQPYVVLANQQVSAAALKEFGFDHYFSTPIGPVYFYPIPTGGPLYQYYLDMVYKSPSRESMNKALRLTGANNGYLIVNKYWYQSDRIINEAKIKADKWWAINNEVYIFFYRN